jgi:hypothetical protein
MQKAPRQVMGEAHLPEFPLTTIYGTPDEELLAVDGFLFRAANAG